MSRHSFRSIFFCSLALFAGAILFALPASAGAEVGLSPASAYAYYWHDVDKAIHDFAVATDKMVIQREAAAFLGNDPVPTIGARGGQRIPFDLKPEYAESYATDGLSFIELRRRC